MSILLVDDHEYNRELLTFILRDEGYESVEAANGKEACDICRNDPNVSLVLMDVTMPEMDGIEATQIIKSQNPDRFLPIIFVTALDDAQVLSDCLNAGGDDFVPKPINESVLLAKIKALHRTQGFYNKLQQVNRQLEFHKQVMDREHQIVEHIFHRGASRTKTHCDNLKNYTSPVSMFNGDIILESPAPSGGVYALIGDFTGHGLAASIGTLPVTEIFYRLAQQQAAVAYIAKEINKSLAELLPDSMFLCAAIVYLDQTGSTISVWSGGMNDIIHLCSESDAQLKLISAQHMPLGVLDEDEFDETPELIDLKPNDRLYLYTDGVTETIGAEGEQFGVARLTSVVSNMGSDVISDVVKSVETFQEQKIQNDDISIMEICAAPVVHRDKESKKIIDVKTKAYACDSFPWSFKVRLVDDELRNNNIVDQLMSFVSGIEGVELHREKIFTMLSELYNNALEHGVLGLDSRMKNTADGFEEYYRLRKERLGNVQSEFIEIELSFEKEDHNRICVSVTDSGQGFDVDGAMERIKNPENSQSHGRGLALLTSLCSELRYRNGGSSVTAVYALQFS